MSKTKQALYWGVIELILGISVYLQYADFLNTSDIIIYKIILFIIFYFGFAISNYLAVHLLSLKEELVINKMYIVSLTISLLIYISLICAGIYMIIEYGKGYTAFKISIIMICNIVATILMFKYDKIEKESDDNE